MEYLQLSYRQMSPVALGAKAESAGWFRGLGRLRVREVQDWYFSG